MKLSLFAQSYASESGIVSLMEDLGQALTANPDMIFMGGGNPSRIIEVEQAFHRRLQSVLNDPEQAYQMLGVYQSPQGDAEFLQAMAKLLRQQFGWPVSANNIAVSGGSQAAFFTLFNLFAGAYADGSHKKIQLPLAPEYLGYEDIGLSDDFFSATRPTIEKLHDNLFKYRVDFDRLTITEETGALCLSRPTNPTGNVVSDEELARLDALARAHDIPLIIDGAYGTPFPNIIFTEARPLWNDNTVVVLSLSKLGLPGARTGIVVASEALIETFSRINTIVNLACGNLGPAIAKPMMADGEILRLSREVIAPFYQRRAQAALQLLRESLAGLPFYIHKPEGAIFLWLWFEGLPISSQELYQRLKARGVLVVSGHHFFPGLREDWPHSRECIRVTYSQQPAVIAQGVEIIAEEVRRAYGTA